MFVATEGQLSSSITGFPCDREIIHEVEAVMRPSPFKTVSLIGFCWLQPLDQASRINAEDQQFPSRLRDRVTFILRLVARKTAR